MFAPPECTAELRSTWSRVIEARALPVPPSPTSSRRSPVHSRRSNEESRVHHRPGSSAPFGPIERIWREYSVLDKSKGLLVIALLAATPASATTGAPPVVSASATRKSAKSEKEILDLVHDYRPVSLRHSCVINGLLFQDWFEEHVPGEWVCQQNVLLLAADGSKLHHRVALFRAGERYYAFDHNVGVVLIRTKATAADPDQLTADAQRAVRAARDGEMRQIATEELFFKDVYQTIYERFLGRRPVAIVAYRHHRAIAFDEKPEAGGKELGRTSVYVVEHGTMSAEHFSPTLRSSEAASRVLKSLFKSDGKFQIVAGDLDVRPPRA